MIGILLRILSAWLLAFVALHPAPGAAAVDVAFYSKEFGATFPHAFVTVEGTVDGTGEKVDASYGFTAKTVSPAVLLGSVTGEIIASAPGYIAKSDRHILLRLSDGDYARLMATVEKWRGLAQPSYNLNHRNCVHFVADLAATLGLHADVPRALVKKPRSYLQWLVRENRALLAQRGAAIAE